MAKVSKEEFEQMRQQMKETARDLINTHGAYGKMGTIYSFLLLHDDSCVVIFNPEKDPKARIGAIILDNELFMAGPTTKRMAGQFVIEALKEFAGKTEVTEEK